MFFVISLSIAQEKRNSIGVLANIGQSGSTYHGKVPQFDWENQKGFFSSYGIKYGRRYNNLEILLKISHNQHSEILTQKVDSFFMWDTTIYAGMKNKETTSFFYFRMAPEIKYNLKLSEKTCFYTGFSLGINHIYREKLHVVSTFESVFSNVDTTYINPNLAYFRKFAFSGAIFGGISYFIFDNFSINAAVYYDTFTHKIFKPSNTDVFWARLFNYGLSINIKYQF